MMAPTPIVALSWFAVSLQYRVDALRVCVLYQRPYPHRVKDIGVWNSVMKFINYAAVINIAGLMTDNFAISQYIPSVHAAVKDKGPVGQGFVFLILANIFVLFVNVFD